MDWMMFDDFDEANEFMNQDEINSGTLLSWWETSRDANIVDPHITPSEYLEQHEYYQQFHPKWDDTLLWIMMLPEQV